MRAYSDNTAGILRSLITANTPGDDPYATLKITGKWNNKTTEDYLAMCKEVIVGNKDMQHDLAVMAEEWRKAVVTEIGRGRYDALSKQLGCDLAYAYIGHRMEQLMIEKMVKDHMPTSSADYIIRRVAQSSLPGLPYELNKSPPAAEIEAKGETAYKPSQTEKAAGRVVGADADVVAIGETGSWVTFAKFVGIDMVVNVDTEHLSKKGSSQEVYVEECISKGVFGTGTNIFVPFRKQAKVIKNHENSYIKAANSHFKNRIPTGNITFMDWAKQIEQTSFPWNKGIFLDPQRNEATKRTGKYKDMPSTVAPGQEDEYLEVKTRLDAEAEKGKKAEPKETPDPSTEEATPSVVQQEGAALQINENGWDGLLQSFELNGFSDIGKNLGYVLAILPDVLVGLFTGKTKSLNMDSSFLPLASIVTGTFVKNPVLEMLLMGMGGANLLNKAGHEVLGREQQEDIAPTISPVASRIQYRQYPDESPSPRISNLMLQGWCLVANIDHVPCTIQLPNSVAGAHQSGVSPLNTLANAMLAKNDQMRQMVAMQHEEQVRESVTRPRGIQ